MHTVGPVCPEWGWREVAEILPSQEITSPGTLQLEKSCVPHSAIFICGLGSSWGWEQKQGGNDRFSTAWRRSILLLKGPDSPLPDRPLLPSEIPISEDDKALLTKVLISSPLFPGAHHQAIKPPLA